jgi:hypothetical protein
MLGGPIIGGNSEQRGLKSNSNDPPRRPQRFVLLHSDNGDDEFILR